jgi:hypothetical protein
MEPTPPSPQTPVPGQPLVEYVRTNRQNVAIGLGALAVLFLAAAVFLAVRGFRTPPEPEKPAEKPAPTNPFDPEEPPELPKAAETPAQIQNQYHLGWIGCLMAFLIVATGAAWLQAGAPPAEEAKQRTEARVLILAVGGLLGAILIVFGLLYFYMWRESLAGWLSKGEVRESKWVLIPVLMMVLGAGMVFLAVQPARADERNNPRLRRVVYGSNLGLTVLLLLIVLAVTNVVFAMRVPNELDTTSSGFYGLADETRDLLKRLDPPVTVYAVVPEGGRRISDLRQFLTACEDASAGKVKVRFVNSTGNTRELAELTSRYTQLDLLLADRQRRGSGALVVAAAPDEKRHVVIPLQDLFPNAGTFAGESRLFKELTLLADNQVKPVVYITQGHGELSVSPGAQVAEAESGDRLRAYLEKNYLDVRALDLAGDNPVVPEDAAVVIVAGPREPFREAAVVALRKYMTTPRGSASEKGKLVVLAGAVPGVGGKGLRKTGLEGLLGEFNVRLGEQYVYAMPTEQSPSETAVLAGFTQDASRSRHPIMLTIVKAVGQIALPMEFAREVTVQPGNPALQGTFLLGSAGDTWVESELITLTGTKLEDFLIELSRNQKLRETKGYRRGGRSLAVTVSEGATPRVAVFGSSFMASDREARGLPPETAPLSYDVVGATVDWLREKPSVTAVEIKAKQYQEYRFPNSSAVSATRLVYLPLALGLLAVIGLGAGVWVIRRK